jgi:hypothetical protein
MYYYIVILLILYYILIIILILCINIWLVPYHVKWSVDEINWTELNSSITILPVPSASTLIFRFLLSVQTHIYIQIQTLYIKSA